MIESVIYGVALASIIILLLGGLGFIKCDCFLHRSDNVKTLSVRELDEIWKL